MNGVGSVLAWLAWVMRGVCLAWVGLVVFCVDGMLASVGERRSNMDDMFLLLSLLLLNTVLKRKMLNVSPFEIKMKKCSMI